MKKVIIGVLTILLCSVTSLIMAQHHGPRGGGHEDFMEELNLSEEQQTALADLKEQHMEEMKAFKDKDFSSREQQREAMKEIRMTHQAAVKEILTDEQETKLTELRNERFQKHQEMRKERSEEMKARHAALKEEMGAYKSENIDPVMLEQRIKMEEKISDEDKQKLDELRVVFADRKEKMTKERGEMKMRAHPRHKGKRGSSDKETRKKDLDPNREAMKSLVVKYNDDIKSLMEEISDEREQWQKDMKAIKEKAIPKMEGERGERRRGHVKRGKHERGMKRKGMDRADLDEKVRGKKAAHFLLMDPKADPSELNSRSAAVRSLNIYPNPVAGQLNISFDPVEEVAVSIELRNEAGQMVRELQPLEMVKREVKWTYDVNNVPDGVYIVVLKGKDQILQSKTIVISK